MRLCARRPGDQPREPESLFLGLKGRPEVHLPALLGPRRGGTSPARGSLAPVGRWLLLSFPGPCLHVGVLVPFYTRGDLSHPLLLSRATGNRGRGLDWNPELGLLCPHSHLPQKRTLDLILRWTLDPPVWPPELGQACLPFPACLPSLQRHAPAWTCLCLSTSQIHLLVYHIPGKDLSLARPGTEEGFRRCLGKEGRGEGGRGEEERGGEDRERAGD